MNIESEAQKVAKYAEERGREFRNTAMNAEQPAYKSMGVLILDGILQAGMDYENFVVPRVHRFCECFPGNKTVSAFVAAARKDGWDKVSSHRGFKLGYMKDLAEFLLAQKVETVDDFRKWAETPRNADLLLSVKGVGPKTRDYLQMLAGAPVVAVDVHLKNFMREAGASVSDSASGYEKAKQIIIAASELYGATPFQLDQAIWLYMAQKKNPKAKNLSAFAGMTGACNSEAAETETVRVKLSPRQMAQLSAAKVGDIVETDDDGNFIVHKTH